MEISFEMPGRLSGRRRPKMTSAGDNLHVGSGVLRSIRRARTILSVSKLPSAEILLIKRRLALFTATSALPFDEGR